MSVTVLTRAPFKTRAFVTLKSRMGNWSMEVGASVASWPRGSGLLMHASLDHREKIWLNGSLEGRCLRSTAGYRTGKQPPAVPTVQTSVTVRKGFDVQVQIWMMTSPWWRAWTQMAV